MEPPIDILLVDDDPRNLAALEAILSDRGYRLLRAEDADRALRMLLDHDVAAIVLDIQMPSCDGFQVARAFRTSPRLGLVPIIAHTSLAEREIIERGKAAGIDAYCRKGDSPRVLLRLIAHLAPTGRLGETVHTS